MKKIYMFIVVIILLLSGCVEDSDKDSVAETEKPRITPTSSPQQTEKTEQIQTEAPEATAFPTPAATVTPQQADATNSTDAEQGLEEIEHMLDGLDSEDFDGVDFSE